MIRILLFERGERECLRTTPKGRTRIRSGAAVTCRMP
jgi:hypothetical protein